MYTLDDGALAQDTSVRPAQLTPNSGGAGSFGGVGGMGGSGGYVFGQGGIAGAGGSGGGGGFEMGTTGSTGSPSCLGVLLATDFVNAFFIGPLFRINVPPPRLRDSDACVNSAGDQIVADLQVFSFTFG